MTADPAAFTGSVPEYYDRYMGPVFFDHYATDLVARARPDLRGEVLELACGTGRLTGPLLAGLPAGARLTATDLHPPMIEHARSRLPGDPRLAFEPADAMALPFPSGRFDAVLCQFGVMFFPDKIAASGEVRRVLRPGGVYHFNVWCSHVDNRSIEIVQRLMVELYPADPPRFYEVPFSYCDPALIHADLERAGFRSIAVTPVETVSVAETARHVATGLIRGTPGAGFIAERGIPGHDEVIDVLSTRLAAFGGESPCRLEHKALAVRAVA
ncbi:MAG TPA: class I SAM-dependent methyltransferase [Dongiaceae bacterium]|nr:class I SAM-dependent methyltransferase [Dongiaceae bacterium]